jgi:hypothetical protein
MRETMGKLIEKFPTNLVQNFSQSAKSLPVVKKCFAIGMKCLKSS